MIDPEGEVLILEEVGWGDKWFVSNLGTLSRGPEREDGAKAVYRQNPEIKNIRH